MSSEIKMPPYSSEAEQGVLGALLRDNDAIDRIGDLRAEHFYVADHATIFGELQRQLAAGRACDIITLMAILADKVEDAGKYLLAIQQSAPSSANIALHASIVRDRAVKRTLITIGLAMADAAYSAADTGLSLVDRVTSRLEKLSESRISAEPVRASTEMAAHIGILQGRLEGLTKAISTGYPAIDAKLSGGLHRGGLYVLAARPKMGKTGLAMNIGCNAAELYSVLFLSLEMPKSQLHDRNLASLGRIPLPHLLNPTDMTDVDWNALTAATIAIDALNLFLDDQGALRMLDVRMKAKGVKRRHGLDLLIVDYLQLMEGDGDNRNAQIEGITRGLKALAKELDIAIILLSQLNRKLEERPNKRPQPSDLRDSGAIEQDADAVIFLYRDEVYNPDTMDIGVCEVDVALCRQGAPGRAALEYIGEQTRFQNMSRGWNGPVKREHKKRGLAAEL